MGMDIKLDEGQKHILKLVARDVGADGWTPVSATLYPHLDKSIPKELLDIELVGDEGRGRARLTGKGENLIDAMAWL